MPDANVPIIGKANKGVLFAGVAAAGTVGAYMLYKHNKNKKTAAAAPAAGTPTAFGYGYGAYSYGYGGMSYPYPNASSFGYGAFGYGMYNPYTGGYGGTVGAPYPQTVAVGTNQEWVREAISSLSAQGFQGSTVIAALALYIEGQPVSSAQESLVQEAIAVAGYPPQPGATGYPPAINTGGAAGGGGQGGGGGGSGLIKVPDLAGKSAGDAHNALVALGLIPTAPPSQKANMKVWYTNPRAGSMVSKGTRVTINTKGYV